MKTGKSLEKLVEKLETVLSDSENVEVESPKKLRDKVTGKLREHDVVVTIHHAHHDLVIAIECRDRSRKVGVGEIEEFYSKCCDTLVDQSVIVSSKGFCRTARKKAGVYGIRCFDLEEVEKLDWLFSFNVVVSNRRLIHTDWTIIPYDKPVKAQVKDFSLVDDEGIEMTTQSMNTKVINRLVQIYIKEDKSPMTTRIVFKGEGCNIRDNSTGAKHPIREMIAIAQYEVINEISPFKLYQYSEEKVSKHIADAAVADLDVGALKGKLIAVHKPDIGIKVIFVPEG